MNDIVAPVVRRAILDLLNDIGGEQNDDVLQMMLGRLGHRVARRDVRDALQFLSEEGLIEAEQLAQFWVARILADGRDVAEGRLVIKGVHRFKTGD